VCSCEFLWYYSPMARGNALARFVTRVREWSDGLPVGLAPLIILLMVLVSGTWLVFHPITETSATLRMWTFANTHYNAYMPAIHGDPNRPGMSFEEKFRGYRTPDGGTIDVTIDVQLVHGDAVTSRLRAAMWSNLDIPDLVEVEISRAGSFFRGPIEDVGFVDLTPYLQAEGLLEPNGIVKTRLAPYTHRGRIFGLPHDVHPVMLAYRADLFRQLGIDPNKLETWDDFIREGRRITVKGERYMIQLSDAGAGNLETLLFQRDGGYFDANGQLIMDDETAVETVKWYIPLVAGQGRIGSDLGFSGQSFAQAVQDGYFLCFICPDWRSKGAEKDMPRLSGKMALMPMPAFHPGGRRTSTWGGTMLGITQRCQDKQLAWSLAKHLYLNPDPNDAAERFRQTNILPPVRKIWEHPAFQTETREYWSNQPIGRLYADLAKDVPPQYASPFIELAKAKMSEVVAACVTYYKDHEDNLDPNDFDAFVRARLRKAADAVRNQMARAPF
jgi:arabinosaccharide transport system substrate-binding protein